VRVPRGGENEARWDDRRTHHARVALAGAQRIRMESKEAMQARSLGLSLIVVVSCGPDWISNADTSETTPTRLLPIDGV